MSNKTCFWCGKNVDDELTEFYTPCKKCRKHMSYGTTILEATPEANSTTNVEIQENVYPTGRWVVMRPEAARILFGVPNDIDKCFLDSKAFQEAFIRTDEVI